jgi:hypothetical protein
MMLHAQRGAPPALPTTPRWPVGTLVVDSEEEVDPFAVRVVVGYKADGRCVTVGMHDPPWMVKVPQERFSVDAIARYRCLAPEELASGAAGSANDWTSLVNR